MPTARSRVVDRQRELDRLAAVDRARGACEQRAVERASSLVRPGTRGARVGAPSRPRAARSAPTGRAARLRAGAAAGRCARWPRRASAARARRAARAAPRRRTGSSSRSARACRRSGARSSGSCVAMPTGQVLRWQTRIMMQPAAISGAVEKANSSAPSSAATRTSRPVRRAPSTCSAYAAAQVVRDEHLLRLGDAELPGQSGVLERRRRRRAGAAVVSGDHDVVGLAPWRRRRRRCRLRPRRPA